jgi:hypothetical protein
VQLATVAASAAASAAVGLHHVLLHFLLRLTSCWLLRDHCAAGKHPTKEEGTVAAAAAN